MKQDKKMSGFYDKDPKEGGKSISISEFFEAIGLPPANPTNNFQKLKQHRLNLFEKLKEKFIEKRNLTNTSTIKHDINMFYCWWLNQELKVVDNWLSDKHPSGLDKKWKTDISDAIEIAKYQHFIEGELLRLTQKKPDRTVLKDLYIFNSKNNDYLYDYLDELAEVFDFNKISDIDFNAICLAIKEKNVFKKNCTFLTIVKGIADYYGIIAPRESKPNKSINRKKELVRKYPILERPLSE